MAPLPRLAHWVGRQAKRGLRAAGAWTAATGGPVAQRAGQAAARTLGAWFARAAATAWRRRGIGLAVLARVGWVYAVWLAMTGARAVLGVDPQTTREALLHPFVAGLAVAAAVVAISAERHVRRGAILVGALHAAAVVLVWTALSVGASAS